MRTSTLFSFSFLSVALPLFALADSHHAQGRSHHDVAMRSSGNVTMSKRGQFSNARFSFYDVGQGACEEVSQPDDFIVALNSAQYGSYWYSPYCKQYITISYGGKTTQAQILDECPGCPYGGLDMSRGLFKYFAAESVGIIYGTWSFNSGGGGGSTPTTTTKKTTTTKETSTYEAPTSTWTPPTTTWEPETTTSTKEKKTTSTWTPETTSTWEAPTTTSTWEEPKTTSTKEKAVSTSTWEEPKTTSTKEQAVWTPTTTWEAPTSTSTKEKKISTSTTEKIASSFSANAEPSTTLSSSSSKVASSSSVTTSSATPSATTTQDDSSIGGMYQYLSNVGGLLVAAAQV